MSSLVAGVLVFLSVLLLLNLLLTFGVIRRIREHSRLLGRGVVGAGAEEAPILRPGSAVGSFDALTVQGAPLALQSLPRPALVGFFSTECGGCREGAASFVGYATAFADVVEGGRRHVVAVVASRKDASDFVSTLRDVAEVIVEPEGGAVQTAFAVTGFPVFCLVSDAGKVIASGYDLAAMPLPQPQAEQPRMVRLERAHGSGNA